MRNIALPVARQAEFDRLINNPLALQHAVARLTANPVELRRLMEGVSERTKELAEEQTRITEATLEIMPIRRQIIFYRKKAREEIHDSELINFIRKYLENENLKDLENITKWKDDVYTKLNNILSEKYNDYLTTEEAIKEATTDREILTMLDKMREGIVAENLYNAAKQYRTRKEEYCKGWTFKRLFDQYENKRNKKLPEEITGSGIK